MKKLTLLLIALFVIGGLSLTTGCKGDTSEKKSDCEKGLANAQRAEGKDGSEEEQKQFIEMCEKFDEDAQKCLATVDGKKALKACLRNGKLKEG